MQRDCRRTFGTRCAEARAGQRRQELEPGDIARRAYEIYCGRGCEDGHETQDWLQAERELRQKSS